MVIRIIKTSEDSEKDIAQHMREYAFHQTPIIGDSDRANRKYDKIINEYLLYDSDNIAQSTALLIPMQQNVRGTIFSMGGIAGVATYPEARRNGYVDKLMNKMFNDMKDMTFSTLYPFKQSFYAKFGYIVFPQVRVGYIDPRKLLQFKDVTGNFDRMLLSNDFDRYIKFIQKQQKFIHGMSLFDISIQGRKMSRKLWIVFVSDDTGDIAMMTYIMKGFEKEMIVKEFEYMNSKGKYLLLKWLANHSDQVNVIHLPIKPNENIETWGLNLRAKITTRDWVPSPMGRVVNISKLNKLPVKNNLEINISIHDDYAPWNNGIWKFKDDNGELYVSPTTDAECKLSIHGLSALIYGTHDPSDFKYLGWGNVSENIAIKLRSMFPRAWPFLYEEF